MTSAASIAARRPRPGRPRLIPERSRLTPREEIIDAAAKLFADQGFAKTSTRMIADAVGIRQASLYYHFPDGKSDLLIEVLGKTIRPTLENVDLIEEVTDDPATALYLLVLLDVRTLVRAPHNSGLLGLLPDVAKEVPDFQKEHIALAAEYGRLGTAAASRHVRDSTGKQLGSILLQNVEVVIGWIADRSYKTGTPDVVAATCLRLSGVDEDTIATAAMAAHELMVEVLEDFDA